MRDASINDDVASLIARAASVEHIQIPMFCQRARVISLKSVLGTVSYPHVW